MQPDRDQAVERPEVLNGGAWLEWHGHYLGRLRAHGGASHPHGCYSLSIERRVHRKQGDLYLNGRLQRDQLGKCQSERRHTCLVARGRTSDDDADTSRLSGGRRGVVEVRRIREPGNRDGWSYSARQSDRGIIAHANEVRESEHQVCQGAPWPPAYRTHPDTHPDDPLPEQASQEYPREVAGNKGRPIVVDDPATSHDEHIGVQNGSHKSPARH